MILSLITIFYSIIRNPKIFYLFFTFLWPICLLLLIYLLIIIYRKKFISFDVTLKKLVKVTNFSISWAIAILYVSFYIAFFFFLRVLQLGTPIDLKKFFNHFWTEVVVVSQYSLYNQLIIILFLIIFILLWLLIFIKIQRYLLNHIWKLSFYYANSHRLKEGLASFSDENLFYLFMANIDYSQLCFQLFYILFPSFKYLKGDRYYLMNFLFTLFPSLCLLLFFILELAVNNFVLYYIFYYFPIYMALIIWIRSSHGVNAYSDIIYAQVLMEIGYGGPEIIYVNILEKEENSMKNFLRNPLKNSWIYDFPELKIHPLATMGMGYFNDEGQYLPIYFKRRFKWMYLKPADPFHILYNPILDPLLYKMEEGFAYVNLLAKKGFRIEELVKLDNDYFVDDPIDPEVMEEFCRKKILRFTEKFFAGT